MKFGIYGHIIGLGPETNYKIDSIERFFMNSRKKIISVISFIWPAYGQQIFEKKKTIFNVYNRLGYVK